MVLPGKNGRMAQPGKNGRMAQPEKNGKMVLPGSDYQTIICFSKEGSCQAEWQSRSRVWHKPGIPMQSRHFLCIQLTRPCIIRQYWHRLLSLTGRSILHASPGNHCKMAFLRDYFQYQLVTEIVLTSNLPARLLPKECCREWMHWLGQYQ